MGMSDLQQSGSNIFFISTRLTKAVLKVHLVDNHFDNTLIDFASQGDAKVSLPVFSGK